ncbi:patatin-like phospholipase family protein [Candidatus Woesearchaeota archaeon]|nr:patatin-like phospholipase family protein [Candidatus Woesearchaeota archaeon]
MINTKPKTAALVFSGGALRGFAQVGAYKAIDSFCSKNNIEIKSVVGTSFGSIVSGFVANGYSADELLRFSKKNWNKLYRLLDFKFLGGSGFLKGEKLRLAFKEYFGSTKFNDLKRELKINAVDLISRKEVVFSKDGIVSVDGSLKIKKDIPLNVAMRVSCSIPFIFQAVKIENLLLVDGGLAKPLALHLINPEDYDYVFAVDVCMANFDFFGTKISKSQVIRQAISIGQMQYHFDFVDSLMKKHSNIFLIRPNVGPVKYTRKNELERIIKSGYLEAKKVLEKI